MCFAPPVLLKRGASFYQEISPLGAIPTSDMEGYRKLHDRVCNALNRCQESQGIDFKESAPWEDLKWRLIKTAMGMGNLRDGGIIVVGASEKGETWNLTGISEKDLLTYDVDNIIDTTNKYCSPPIEVDVVLVKYTNGSNFLAFQFHEFSDTPFVCKRNGPDGSRMLTEGEVYVRPPGKARTTKVTVASEMHDLIELAAEKKARKILEQSYRIGLTQVNTASKKFDDELGGL